MQYITALLFLASWERVLASFQFINVITEITYPPCLLIKQSRGLVFIFIIWDLGMQEIEVGMVAQTCDPTYLGYL